jgi:hypothetical protein
MEWVTGNEDEPFLKDLPLMFHVGVEVIFVEDLCVKVWNKRSV